MTDDNTYAGYGLDGNPFDIDESIANISSRNDLTRFYRIVCAAEITRLAKTIQQELLTGGGQPVWLLEDEKAQKRFNIVVSTGVIRYLVTGQETRILPIYVPLPQVASDFTGNVFRLIIDGLLPRYLRNVTYAFIRRELEKAVNDNSAGLSIDASGLLKEIEATGGGILDEIFFGAEFTLTKADEYGGIVEPIRAEETEEVEAVGEDEVEGPEFVDHDVEEETIETESEVASDEVASSPEEQEEEAVDERREPLVAFVAGRLSDESSAAGESLQEAVMVSLDFGFVEGRRVLEKAPAPRDEIMGLIRMISLYYSGIVIIIDQLDPWPLAPEPQKITILSDIYQVELAAGGKAVIVMTGGQPIYDGFDKAFTGRCKVLPMRLSWTLENAVDFGKDNSKTEALVKEFISSTRTDGKPGLEPFDSSGIAAIVEKAGGNVVVILELCRQLIDAGRGAGFPKIDKAFVKQAL